MRRRYSETGMWVMSEVVENRQSTAGAMRDAQRALSFASRPPYPNPLLLKEEREVAPFQVGKS
jgi:hypothetical protein